MKSNRHNRHRFRSKKPLFTLPDLLRIQPRLSLFSQEDCLRIHLASLDILRRTGIEVFCPPALDLLQKAGASVKENLVKLPPALVIKALASVPSWFSLYRRGSETAAIVLDGRSATEKLLFCVRNSLPITHSPAPMIGGAAPITLAGAVALGNAELLSRRW